MEALKNRVERAIEDIGRRPSMHAVGIDPPALPRIATPRDQGKNHDTISAVLAGLSVCRDLTPWTMRFVLDGAFPLLDEFKIDPRPLYGFNTPATASALFQATFHTTIADVPLQLDALIAALKRIERDHLLGRNTTQKMSYVEACTGQAWRDLSPIRLGESADSLARLLARTVELLQKSLPRQPPQSGRFDSVRRALHELQDFRAVFALHRYFSDYRFFADHPAAFFTVFADLVVETIAARRGPWQEAAAAPAEMLHLRRGRGVEWSFHPRDGAFIYSGDAYGDCTAHRVRSQVDDTIANIHWTVYAWLLDPYYRVIEITLDAKRALKCHVLPLVIQDRPLLMLDAIEVVPQLRERKDGSPNPDLDSHLYEHRVVLLETLFEVCRGLATRMGLNAIYVEKFSNAKWVREEIDKLPDDSYHIDDVTKPFESRIVNANIRMLTERDSNDTKIEIQAKNPWLMHRQMRSNYKDVGVLRGRRDDWSLRISGP